jgi:hypothetical protein
MMKMKMKMKMMMMMMSDDLNGDISSNNHHHHTDGGRDMNSLMVSPLAQTRLQHEHEVNDAR